MYSVQANAVPSIRDVRDFSTRKATGRVAEANNPAGRRAKAVRFDEPTEPDEEFESTKPPAINDKPLIGILLQPGDGDGVKAPRFTCFPFPSLPFPPLPSPSLPFAPLPSPSLPFPPLPSPSLLFPPIPSPSLPSPPSLRFPRPPPPSRTFPRRPAPSRAFPRLFSPSRPFLPRISPTRQCRGLIASATPPLRVRRGEARRVDVAYNVEEEEEEEVAAEDAMREQEAWERSYANDRSWESVQEDESGRLRPVDVAGQQRSERERRRRQQAGQAGRVGAQRVRRGIIRYLVLALDFSRVGGPLLGWWTVEVRRVVMTAAMPCRSWKRQAASEVDMKPSRMAAMARSSEAFILNFFDSNPLSHLALLLLRDGVASQLSELTSPPDAHIKALQSNLSASGPASLQNVLEAAVEAVAHVPAYGHRELLLLFAALASTDPGDILPAIRRARAAHLRCSIIGVGGAEVHICRHIAEQTGGRYSVAMDDAHLRELLMSHAPPPPVQAGSAGSAASLVRMGFPQRAPEGAAALCACHMHLRLAATYVCPRCRSRVCALPAECPVCALTLVSSPHLARSYHHLFPVPPFSEVPLPPAPKRPAGQAAPAAPHSGLPLACFSCTAALPLL
ncbi:unnamed protein product, partial [Closterium sp. Naga37s-1]